MQENILFLWLLWRHVPRAWLEGSLLTLYDGSLAHHFPASEIANIISDEDDAAGFGDLVTELNRERDLWICAGTRDTAAVIEAHDKRRKKGKLPPIDPRGLSASAVRGGRRMVSLLSALTMEFDVGDEGHAKGADALPGSKEQIDEAVAKAGVGAPSLIVRSGHGFHYWWVLEEAVRFFIDGNDLGKADSFRHQFGVFQDRIRAAADFHIDSTAGAERHWRLAGTFNRKIPDKPRSVEIVDWNENLYSLSDLSGVVPRKSRTVTALLSKAKKVANDLSNPEVERLLAAVKTRILARKSDDELQDEFLLLLEGKSYAVSTDDENKDNLTRGRNNTTYRMLSRLLFMSPEARKLAVKNILIERLWGPVLAQWHEAEPTDEWTVEHWDESCERILSDFEDQEERRRVEAQAVESALTKNFAAADEPATIIRPDGVEVLPRIVRNRNQFYIYSFLKNEYEPRSFDAGELLQKCQQSWGPDHADDLTKLGENNKVRNKTPEELSMDFGIVTNYVRQSVLRQVSFYNREDETYYDAVCPYRKDLELVYSPRIDEFIAVFAGGSAELLRDYLASMLHLDGPCAGMYLQGGPRTGKGFIADGLASLWNKPSPTDFDKFLGPERFSYLETPLIHLNEGLQDTRGISSRIRRLITEQNTHTMEHKGKDPFQLEGTLRLLITANNPDAISEIGASHTRNDIDAIIERIAHINVSDAGREWLKETNERLKVEQKKEGRLVVGNRELIRSGEFANHVAWLGANRELERDRLFCATDEMTPWHLRYLLQGSEGDSNILQWVARMATNPSEFYKRYAGTASVYQTQIGNGFISLRSQELLDNWKVYMEDTPKPSIKAVNRALEKLCDRDGLLYHVRIPFLKLYVEQNQIGDWDRIEKNIHGLVLVK